ncbi:MAG: hypothetical protein U9M95_03095 [Candidatus Altiarchaeota archaeon]|nr:hypothetical protein [Candidatus Altiarchaeota archaeon]
MKATMVIPSYWGRESEGGWREGDCIYDHPTPLDEEGTLHRALESLALLQDKDFRVVVIAVATAEDIEDRVEKKTADIIKSASPAAGVGVLLFGPSKLRRIHDVLIDEGMGEYIDLLQTRGYSNIRNLCMFIPHILGSDVAALIDDDEVFEDPEFMAKAMEYVGGSVEGNPVNAVAGYYIQPDGGYRIKKPFHPWMEHWNQYDKMNEAFDKIIGCEPRLKKTSFVFGGNLIIHRNLFTVVPFDPNIPRGEDIDFLMNARLFGFTFYLDKELSIRHLPPPKTHPVWMQLREDVYRFIYERAKIEHQRDVEGMDKIYPGDFDPYPGCFLKKDLEEKIKKSCKLLSEEYLARGDRKSSEEALNNIALARGDAIPESNPFQTLCRLQKRWQKLMAYTGKQGVCLNIKEIIEEDEAGI